MSGDERRWTSPGLPVWGAPSAPEQPARHGSKHVDCSRLTAARHDVLQHGLASTVMIGIDVALGTAALVVGMITAPVGTLVVLTCGAFAATFSFGLSWVGLHGDVALAQKSVGRWDRASELEVERRYYKEAIDELDRLEPALARAEVRALVALGLFLFGILTLLVW